MLYKRNLGKKYVCHACGAKYYDLNRALVRCPNCNADPGENPMTDPRAAAMARVRSEGGTKKAPSRFEPEVEEEVDPEATDDEEVGDLEDEEEETGDEDEEGEEGGEGEFEDF
jgi:uncharacterized protein (TIGR02300 family)